jgi:hypothetical protein
VKSKNIVQCNAVEFRENSEINRNRYQSLNTFGSKDIAQVKGFSKLGQSSRSRSQGQKSRYQKKGLIIIHLYLKYQSPNTFG